MENSCKEVKLAKNSKTHQISARINGVQFLTFQDTDEKWRWHAKSKNGQIVATSGESFDKKYNAERAMIGFLKPLGIVCVYKD